MVPVFELVKIPIKNWVLGLFPKNTDETEILL